MNIYSNVEDMEHKLALNGTFSKVHWAIYLGVLAILLFAILFFRGFYSSSVELMGGLMFVQFTIGFISIFHAWVLTVFYRNKTNFDSSSSSHAPTVNLFLSKHIFSHALIAVATVVLLGVVVYKSDAGSLNTFQVIGSYLFGLGLMIFTFYAFSKGAKHKAVNQLCGNFAALVTTYLVIGFVFYEKLPLFEFLIDWYPFGNIFLNF